MVHVVGTWARDLNLPVPLVPVSGMGTMIVPPHPARLVRRMELQRDRFVDTFIVLTGGKPSTTRALGDHATQQWTLRVVMTVPGSGILSCDSASLSSLTYQTGSQ